MRRVFRYGLFALVLTGLGASGLWLWLKPTVPVPPAPPMAILDDLAVADLLSQAFNYVKRKPSEGARRARLGMVYEANKLPELAKLCYEHAVAMEPSVAKWWYHLAIVEEDLGDIDDAMAAMDRAIARDGAYAPCHWRRGLWLLDEGDTGAAIKALLRATELDADDANGWLILGRAYLQKGASDQAAAVLERVLQEHRGNRYASQLLGTAYRQLGRMEEAKVALVRGKGAQPEWRDSWQDEVLQYRAGYMAVLKKALRCFETGEFETMVTLLEPWRVRRPHDVALLNNLGMAYLAAGRYAEGIETLGTSVREHPEHYAAYLNLATAYYRTGDMERALAHANRAVELNPRLGKAYETRGYVLWRMGRFEDALASFTASARLDARNPLVLVWAGMVQCELERWSAALENFERVTRLDPTIAKAHLGVSLAKMGLGSLDEAADALGRAEALDSEDPQLAGAKARLKTLRADAKRPVQATEERGNP